MRRSGFTLIELLIIIGIIAAMAGTAVIGVVAGKSAASMKMASRGVLQYVRHARNVALLTQQAVVLTFQEETDEADLPVTIISMRSRNSALSEPPLEVEDIHGNKISRRDETEGEDDDGKSASGQRTLDVLQLIPENPAVFTGVCCRVSITTEESRKRIISGVSVFSNVGYLMGNGGNDDKKNDSDNESVRASEKTSSNGQDPVSITYEVNGRCSDAFRVRLFKPGEENRDERVIDVDIYGKIKVEKDE